MVTRIENGADAKQSTIDRLRRALEAAGKTGDAPKSGGRGGPRVKEGGGKTVSRLTAVIRPRRETIGPVMLWRERLRLDF